WSGDDRWFPADFPPRQGNRLTPLVDGQEAMQAMYDAMEHARASIYLTGWFITPQLRMLRPPDNPEEPCAGTGGPHALLPLLARRPLEDRGPLRGRRCRQLCPALERGGLVRPRAGHAGVRLGAPARWRRSAGATHPPAARLSFCPARHLRHRARVLSRHRA